MSHSWKHPGLIYWIFLLLFPSYPHVAMIFQFLPLKSPTQGGHRSSSYGNPWKKSDFPFFSGIPSGYLLHSHGIDGPFIDGLPIKNGDFP